MKQRRKVTHGNGLLENFLISVSDFDAINWLCPPEFVELFIKLTVFE